MKSIMRSILVTGAGGFIGRHIVECLRRQNPETEIVALDREGRENIEADYCVSCDLVKEHKSEITEIILRHDVGAIVHCAGSVGSEFASLLRDNLLATTSLIETLSEIKPCLPFCHLGSSAEYKPLDMPKKTSEDTLEEPVGDYGRVKLQTTQAVLKATSKGDISGYVLRLFNPIGVGMAPITIVGQVCEFLRNDQDVDLHLGSLDSYRDFIDVRDVANAVVLSLQQVKNLVGEVVNIGTGIARCTRDLVNGLISFCPRPVSLEESRHGSSRSAAVHWQEADISKLKRLLGWQPDFLFEQTIEHIARNNV